jgi:hypothetical protein
MQQPPHNAWSPLHQKIPDALPPETAEALLPAFTVSMRRTNFGGRGRHHRGKACGSGCGASLFSLICRCQLLFLFLSLSFLLG